jgi:CheY-like chemotaxis protein
MVQPTTAAPRPAIRRRERGVGLLVVEDEVAVRQEFGNYLRGLGFFVRVARSGAEAIRLADSPELDIVLLDLVMPGLGGLEAGRRIQTAHPEKAIIVLSHFIDEESRLNADSLGLEVMEWVDKPDDEGDLEPVLAAIERTIEQLDKRRARRLLASDEARGLEAERVLRLVKRWEPDFPDRVVEDLTREVGSHSIHLAPGDRRRYHCRRQEAGCCLPELMTRHGALLARVQEAFASAAAGNSGGGGNPRLAEAVGRILNRQPVDWQIAKGQKNCWPLGDTIIALEAPEDAAIYTTDHHYEVICAVIGRQIYRETIFGVPAPPRPTLGEPASRT